MADLKLGLRIDASVSRVDEIRKLADDIEALGGDGQQAAADLDKLNQELKLAANQSAAIKSYRDASSALDRTATALERARETASKLGRKMAATTTPTREMSRAFTRARDRVVALKVAQLDHQQVLATASRRLRDAGVRADRLVASERKLAAETQTANARLDALNKSLQRTRARLTRAGDAGTRAGRDIRDGADQATAGVATLSSQLAGLRKLALAGVAGAGLKSLGEDVVALADQYKRLNAQLALVDKTEQSLSASQRETFRVAQDTRTALDDVVTLYTRMRRALEEAGAGQKEVLQLTETISQAMKISGASTTESAAAIQQLGQAMASGVLRGDEFNSIMEQAPRLARAMADGIGVPIGALRKMAEAGELTTERVRRALGSQAQAIADEFSVLPQTVSDAWTNVESAWQRVIGQADAASGASGRFAESLQLVADNMETLAGVAADAGIAALAAAALAATIKLGEYSVAARAARIETLALGGAAESTAKKLSLAQRAIGLVGAAFTGWELGKWINSFAPVQRVAVMTVGGLDKLRVSALALRDVLAAPFTDGTVDAAMVRYRKRLADIDAVIVASFQRIDEAARQAAAGTAELGRELDATGKSASTVARAQQGQQASMQRSADAAVVLGQQIKALDELQKRGVITAKSAAEQQAALTRDFEAQHPVARRTADEYASIANAMRGQIAAAKSLSDVQRIIAQAQGLLAGNTDEYGRVALAAAQRIDALMRSQKDMSASSRELSDSLGAVTDSTQENYRAMLDLAKAYREGSLSAADYYAETAKLSTANSDLRAEQKKNTGATRDNADALNKTKEGADAAGKSLGGFTDLTRVVKSRYAELSNAAARLFDQQMKGVWSVKTWWEALSDRQFERVKQRYEGNIRSVDALQRRIENGTATLQEMQRAARATAHGMDLLDKEQLGGLQSALDSARAKMDALSDSARSTLSSLQDELDQLNGNQRSIEQRRFDARRAELVAQLAEAQRAADAQSIASLRESLQLLDEIHRRKLRDIEAERRARDVQNGATANSAGAGQPGAGIQPTRTVRVELAGPSGEVTPLDLLGDNAAERFLRALETAGYSAQ